MFNIAIVDHRPIYHCTRSLKEANTLKSMHKVSFICVDSELGNRTYEKESIYYYTIKSISFSPSSSIARSSCVRGGTDSLYTMV